MSGQNEKKPKAPARSKADQAIELVQSMRLRELRDFVRELSKDDRVLFAALHGYMQAESEIVELAQELDDAVREVERTKDYRHVHATQLGIPPAMLGQSEHVTATEIEIARTALEPKPQPAGLMSTPETCRGHHRGYKVCADYAPDGQSDHFGRCASCHHNYACHGQ